MSLVSCREPAALHVSHIHFRITSLAKASPGAFILGLVVPVALGKCMEERSPAPQYMAYAPAPEAPSLPTPSTPTPSALPDPSPLVTAIPEPPQRPVKST